MKLRFLTLFLLGLFLGSCASREKLAYYQNIENLDKAADNYQLTLKSDDLLLIIVSSPVPEAALDFNLATYGIVGTGLGGTPDAAGAQLLHQTYLIDRDGMIQFPVLGPIKMGGKTREAAIEDLKKQLVAHIKEPIVNMRVLNYKVSVQGEVLRPGTFTITTERVTLPEVLTMAGDLTIYAKRDNILVIREIDGKKTHNFVDITQANFMNSPFYYMSQNDLVYVEPNKTKMNSAVVGPNISIALSALSLLITVVALLIR